MTEATANRPMKQSLWRGLKKKCPNCGVGNIFERYLKPTKACGNCGEELSHIRTDDFAPWLTILVLGHILIPTIVEVERNITPPLWVHAAIWLPLATVLVLLLLPFSKGVCLGLMWSLGLRGDEQH